MSYTWHSVTLPCPVPAYGRFAREVHLLRESYSFSQGERVELGAPAAMKYHGEEKIAAPVLNFRAPCFLLIEDVNLPWLSFEAEERMMQD